MEEHATQITDEQNENGPNQDGQTAEGGVGARRRLGRGLSALLGGDSRKSEGEGEPASNDSAPLDPQLDPNQIHVELIDRNPFQPRKEFDSESLNELAESIKQHGILQPILVRPHNGEYQLIAGERRWLAAKKAGLETVPCRVLELEDQSLFEAAIEENLKRKDLNVLEKAQAFQDYLNRFGSTIEDLARKLSMNRSTVSNFLRLLELPEEVQKALRSDKITNGHARSLLSLDEERQIALCKQIQKEGLSVRKTEELVRAMQQGEGEATIPFPNEAQEKSAPPEVSNHVLSLQDQLRDHLGAKVEIKLTAKDKGKIVIQFDSNDEFERIVRSLRKAA